jgi:hypothetical protein
MEMRRLSLWCALLGAGLPLASGRVAWARPDEGARGPTRATPARYEAAGQAGAPRPAAAPATPVAPASHAANAPGPSTSRGSRVARGASVSAVFIFLAIVTLILV